jgi:poly-gamma-glutamate biosynthesis protein PgsC/CapC
MISLLTLSVGIGLLVGLFFVEAFGLFAGGMVVPGYIALDIIKPGTVALTLVTAILINLVIRVLSKFLVIYGRRRVSLTVLIAFLMGVLVRQIFSNYMVIDLLDGELYSVIGYIVPGLIALSIDRQGLIETFATLLTVSVMVRLCLIIIIGPVLLQ